MTLTPGTRLGVFEIVSTLGVGGMGEVYLATDTRLKRQVAIKILPQSLAADADRLARFQREAELLASLNHPNIAVVYGIEDTSAGKALVMELVEGSDLRTELARRTPTVPEALSIARQLTKAIAAAHQRGIVHRDLKPGNIRLRPDGTLKVLDFGLAKAVSDTSSDDQNTVTATRAGTIMGTPRYMSPEQARGEVAGTQSDIWAFGVILYEMLAGRAAFDAGTSAETLSRVLTTEPDYQRLPSDLPARIKLLVQRCLRKDPQQRLHHIGDAAIEIDEAMSPADAIEPAPASNRIAIVWLVAAVSIIVGAAAGWWAAQWPAEKESPVLRTEISFPERPPDRPFGMRHLAFSPDGSRIAFASRTSLQIRRLDESDVTRINTSATSPFWSPDGQWVGYLDSDAGLTKVPAAGGAPTLIAATTDRPAGGDWRADGTIVFATSRGLFLVREDGTGLRSLLAPDAASEQRALAWPQFLPETNAVLFTIVPIDTIDRAQIATVDLDTLKVEVVLHGGAGARYAGTGHLLYASGRTFSVIRFDPRRRRTSGEATQLSDVSVAVAADNGVPDFSLSEAGDLAFLSPATPPGVRLSWVDRKGGEEPLDLPPARYAYPRVSPDGTRVVMDITGANRDVWLYDVRRRSLGQFTSGPTEDLMPVWSPDGLRVFFASDRSGNFEIYSRAADGATPERMEFARDGLQFPQGFTPDGTRLTLTENYHDVALLYLSQPAKVDKLLQTSFSERIAEVSPDGKWLAYESNEAGERVEVFVRSFPDIETRREKVSIAGGRYPRWNPSSGRELFYVTPDGAMMVAAMSFSPSLSIGNVTKLFDVARPPAAISGRPYDVSPLDGRFLVTRAAGDAIPAETRASLVLNWAKRLRENR